LFFEANAKNPNSQHFKQFLEEQSKELTLAKR